MYSFTLNKIPYSIPSKASELTLGQFVAIRNIEPNDELGLLSILAGEMPEIKVTSEKEIKGTQKVLNNVFKLIDMLTDDLATCLKCGKLLEKPKKVNVMALEVDIKPNLVNSLPYWGFVHTREVIKSKAGKNEAFDATDEIAGILAHNLYCLVTKNVYNEAKAEEFIDVILEMNFIEAMQLGNFFLIQQRRLWTSRRKRWIMRLNLWKMKLVSKFSRNTEPLTSSKLFPVEMFFDGKR